MGGHAEDGRWFQIFLWRAGVPLRFAPIPWDGWIRTFGWVAHWLRHRGQFQVVVRLDPEERRYVYIRSSMRGEEVWIYGPWDRSTAQHHKTALAAAIDAGSWDPRINSAPPAS